MQNFWKEATEGKFDVDDNRVKPCNHSLFQAPRETREGKGEGTKTRGTVFVPSPFPSRVSLGAWNRPRNQGGPKEDAEETTTRTSQNEQNNSSAHYKILCALKNGIWSDRSMVRWFQFVQLVQCGRSIRELN